MKTNFVVYRGRRLTKSEILDYLSGYDYYSQTYLRRARRWSYNVARSLLYHFIKKFYRGELFRYSHLYDAFEYPVSD